MTRRVVFELEAITALFLHGANNTSEAELRAAPLKAAARYWFRAVVGDSTPLNCDEGAAKVGKCGCLRCLEGRLFGSTDAGKSVGFYVAPRAIRSVNTPLLPHHPESGNGPDHPSPSPALAPGSTFEVQIMAARPTLGHEIMDAVIASFWLAVRLGGFGQRSRRGAGSLSVASVSGANVELPWGRANDAKSLAENLQTGIKSARAAVHKFVPALPMAASEPDSQAQSLPMAASAPPAFPQLQPNSKYTRIQIVPLKAGNEQAARAEVMTGLKPYKNPVFGLPYLKPAQGDRTVNGRHASPLWIHIEKVGGGEFVAVQTAMCSQSLPGSWSKVEDYLNSFPNRQTVKIE